RGRSCSRSRGRSRGPGTRGNDSGRIVCRALCSPLRFGEMPGVKTQPLDRIDQELLNLVQVEFPVVPAPFASLAETLGVGENEVLDRLAALKKNKIIRQISAIFDTRALGYKSSLVATRAPADRVDQVAAAISDHPGVSHNYRRDHEFNIWWTVAVPPTSSLEEHV